MTTYVAGDDLDLIITAQSDDETAIDLTSSTIIWHLKKTSNILESEVIEKTTASGITIVDATQGIFKVSLTGLNTNSLEGTYIHITKIINASGKTKTLRKIDLSFPTLTWIKKLIE